ncbi:hypothetical protein SmJEL517_g05177 [Synchytrium microbalum]|uniref:Vesicle transport protein USE1 n=1 Tax=Synchytrium microbalum TaxID=1806994 RepID=A0A507C0G0_9FUNG|nr:uncharacterized protein SmJEL517_g05177 [Synchytrium microbalum]TPX31456.1 hypothetical protein SmJEL517_g05177 [Synchytrium microbalum]
MDASSIAEVNLRRLLASTTHSTNSSEMDAITIIKTQKNLQYARQLVEVIAANKSKGYEDPLLRDAIRTLDQLEAAYCVDQLPLREQVNIAFRRGVDPPKGWQPSLKTPSDAGPLTASKSSRSTDQHLRSELLGTSNELRKRGPPTTPTTTTTTSSSPSPDAELETVLQHHRGLQDQLSEELARMASQLKMNSLALGTILKQDAKVLDEASGRLETTVTRVKTEGTRLGRLTASTSGTFCLTLAVVAIVFLVFMWTFFFMFFFKKRA